MSNLKRCKMSPEMNEEGKLDLLPFFPDEDDEDGMLDESCHTLQAPALLGPIPHPQQL